MSTEGQGHLLTLVQVTQIQYFQTITAKPIQAKFHVEPPLDGRKVCSNGLGVMTIYGKNF